VVAWCWWPVRVPGHGFDSVRRRRRPDERWSAARPLDRWRTLGIPPAGVRSVRSRPGGMGGGRLRNTTGSLAFRVDRPCLRFGEWSDI
jgi:hypothetical protein